jgi:predicted nucleic acid-binding protein
VSTISVLVAHAAESGDHQKQEFLKAFVTLTPDHESARLWRQLAAELKSNATGDLDFLMESIALSKKQTLTTRNKYLERVSWLEVEGCSTSIFYNAETN